MTAKEFLRRARNIDRRLNETMERAKRIRARLYSGRLSSLTGMPRGGSGDWTQTADQLIELERRVNEQVRQLARLKLQAMKAIEAVKNPQQREVLELYYLDGLGWQEVAERMNYSRRNVIALHGAALRRVKAPEEVEEG